MIKTTTREFGQQIEKLSKQFLNQQGLKFIDQNYHCRHGEIDLIMKEHDILVFVEVRFRHSTQFGGGLESVNYTKQQKLIATAQHYLQKHHILATCRFDVISVKPDGKQYQFEWVKNAFQC